MAVATRLQFLLTALETAVNDQGVATMPHRFEYPLPTLNSGKNEYDSGTTDNKFDLVWSDRRTLTATSEDLDLRGVLTAALGGAAISYVEVCGLVFINEATAAASVLSVGAGSNPAFAGLFGATGDIVKVPASGCLFWFAPLDGGGLATTAGTADILHVDSGSATVTYRVGIIGRSA